MSEPLCHSCGGRLSVEAGNGELQCGPCLASPPPYDRGRAVMDYGSVAKAIAHRLKYGRRIGLAEVMGAHMARLLQDPEPDSLLLPVPLHRWRIWSRGFNQAALVAREIGRRQNLPVALDLLRRTRNTPPPATRSAEAARSTTAVSPASASTTST